MERLWRATINTWNGLVAAARSEQAFRQELWLAAVAVPLALWLTDDFARRFALIGTIFLIMIAELLNTAIEKLADRVTMENDKAIGRVKDMGSAAVGLSLLLAGLAWLWVIAERFLLQRP
ncbi:MAG: diacylglycerol kinase [Pseudolabrys sp.]